MVTPISEMLEKGKSSGSPEAYYDSIAELYDKGKKKNLYYFENLVSLYNSFVKIDSRALDLGCGTGDLTARLKAKEVKGIDLSEEMINVAKKKYGNKANVSFERVDIFASNEKFAADYITMADVLEHVVHVPSFMKQIGARTNSGTKVVISVINPIWEPVMMIAEKLKLKIPEGPHERLSVKVTEGIFRDAGFKIEETGYRFIVPKRLPLADPINRSFYKNKVLARFGLVIFWVLTK